jgi:methylmalonyl-CoA mutase
MPDTEDLSPDLAFASEFPAATLDQWRKLVDGVLKGAPFEKRLVSRSYDNLPIEPLYPRAAGATPVAGRAPGTPWRVMQRIDHPDSATANEQVLHDLENGATGLTLVCRGSINANGYGLDSSVETLSRVLDGVYLDAGVVIDFNVAAETRDAAKNFAALVKARGLDPKAVELRGSINPLGHNAATGTTVRPWPELAPYFAALVKELADAGFGGPFAVADGRVIHNAGGSEAQELAFALACAVTYLRALEANAVALDAARRMIYFRLACDADQFLSVAKFRAARKLWARVEQACGLAPLRVHVAAETAWRMMTRRDPYVNMLRATVAVVAAGLGGADAITVLPFTLALGLPDRFARRIARNTQLILLEESNLAKVADPSAGAGSIEALTDQLCAAAWSLFQEIETAGGAAAALEQDLIQSKVAATRAEREKNVARRRDPLTGTSEFPDIHELPVQVLDVAPRPAEVQPAPAFAALPRIRLAEPFEALRDASDRALATTGARPKVFLANLGKLSDFSARTLYARNFFEAGGIEAISNDGFADRGAMVAAFRGSGAKLACLCSSDKVYETEAVDAAKALAATGAAPIYLAGRAGELEGALKAAGVGGFIHVGCDVVATLRAAHQALGL